ncbi:MAG: hypothetical protein HC903_06520 [Methylacidiphilales bacterium]|nr:hypothetical protein [Candidatus Methylacidiphilales bacterium]NJR71754.1 hypothetical protein [Gammaproteobacteria bacterium]
MSYDLFTKIPIKPLLLLWLAYTWLGWYLSAYHIGWLFGAFVLLFVLTIVWQTTSWLEKLIEIGSKTLVVVLFLSLSVALVASWSLLFSLFLMPLATTILTNMELRLSGLTRLDRLILLSIFAGMGLIVGEIIDIFFLPSIRY